MRIDHNDIYLLTILGEAPETTTNELAQKMNVSAKTVQRQLTKLQEIIEQLEMGIQLTINPSKGIQLEGDYNQLPLLIQRMKQLAVNEEQDRLLYIVSVLLNSTEAVTLQTFADDMYIARSTVEKAVHDARNFLSDFDVEIEGTRKGLVINANESLKRKILSELIREYWHGIVVNIDGSQEGLIDISLNSQLMPAIEVSILNEVQHLVYQFMKDNGLSFNEDQYQSLVIYISVMIDRIRKHHYIDEVEVKTEVPMIDLTSQLIQQLKNTFTMEIPVFERQYIATYIEGIIINSHKGNGINAVVNTKYSNQILSLLETFFEYLEPDQTLLDNLTLHLNASIKRLESGIRIRNPHRDRIIKDYSTAFNLAVELGVELSAKFNLAFNIDEISYTYLWR